jgi:hypothetical protein
MVKDKSVRTVDVGVHGKVVVSDFEKTLSQESKTGDVPDAEIPGLPRGWKRKIKNGRPVRSSRQTTCQSAGLYFGA